MPKQVHESGKISVMFLPKQTISDILASSCHLADLIDRLPEDERMLDREGLVLGLLFVENDCIVRLGQTYEALWDMYYREFQYTLDIDDVTAFRTVTFSKLYAPGHVSFASAADFLRGDEWKDLIKGGVFEERRAA